MKAGQTGFTLAELLVTIVVVGVLAAVAVPRFISVTADARASVIKATAGAMKQANDAIFSKAVIDNLIALSSGTITNMPGVSGGSVSIVYGYASNTTELTKVMTLTDDLSLSTSCGTGLGGDNGCVQHNKAASRTSCQIGYKAATNSTTPPVLTATVSDCS